MDQALLLLDLQEHDLTIARLRKQLDEMPERKAILEVRRKLADVAKLRERAEAQHAAILRQISAREDEVSVIEGKLEAEQARLMSGEITNPKEMQHITREMDALRRQKERIEYLELETLESREKAEGQIAAIEAAGEGQSVREAELIASFRAKGGQVKTDIDRLTVERGKLAKKIEAQLLKKYDSVCAVRHGTGVGRLEAGSCSACRVQLPGERVEMLKSGPAIGECPMCHRILVIHTGGEGGA
jgi:predicted  nucleic acid-binding Zn-ribbon protein